MAELESVLQYEYWKVLFRRYELGLLNVRQSD